MRNLFVLFVATLSVSTVGQAIAAPQPWNGTLELKIGALKPVVLTGSGVATVNNSGGGVHLSTLRLAGGITGSGIVPVTDPDVTGTVPGSALSSFRIDATLGTGTFFKAGASVDLVSGTTGVTKLNQSFNNETRGIDVTVLGSVDRVVTAMTLTALDTSSNPTTVGARIFTSGGTLVASGSTSVAAGSQPPIRVPISATLTTGASYRIAFHSGSGVADIFDPDSTPYTEASGTLQVNGAFSVSGDGFPNIVNAFFPMIQVSLVPLTSTGSALIPARGLLRLCRDVFGTPSCAGIDLTKNGGATGVGIGGTVGTTIPNFITRISLQAAPWTIGTAMAVNQTVGGGFVTLTRTGFAHGPASATGSTRQASGVIQLITPIQIIAVPSLPGNIQQIAMFGTLTLHFVPEPGYLLMIGSGALALLLIGRRRM